MNTLSLTTRKNKKKSRWKVLWQLVKKDGDIQFAKIKQTPKNEQQNSTILASITRRILENEKIFNNLVDLLEKQNAYVTYRKNRSILIENVENVDDIGDILDSFGCQWETE